MFLIFLFSALLLLHRVTSTERLINICPQCSICHSSFFTCEAYICQQL